MEFFTYTGVVFWVYIGIGVVVGAFDVVTKSAYYFLAGWRYKAMLQTIFIKAPLLWPFFVWNWIIPPPVDDNPWEHSHRPTHKNPRQRPTADRVE